MYFVSVSLGMDYWLVSTQLPLALEASQMSWDQGSWATGIQAWRPEHKELPVTIYLMRGAVSGADQMACPVQSFQLFGVFEPFQGKQHFWDISDGRNCKGFAHA